jgi:hypothetical protein
MLHPKPEGGRMRVFLWSLLGFAVGLLAGYFLVLGGWLAYAELFQVRDLDGNKIMGVTLILAPLGALVLGFAAAFSFGLRAAWREAR